jgi:hypothetical protein
VVSLARGGRGQEKEVTARFRSGIKFSLGGNSQKHKNHEAPVVFGKTAARGL